MPRATFIYFVQPEGGGLIKIGRADDPEARLRGLQVGSPVKLKLCSFHEADTEMEMRLHFLFAAYREHGEWFRACPALAEIANAIPDPSIEDAPIDGTRQGSVDWQFKVAYGHGREDRVHRSHESFERSPQEPVTALPDDANPEWHWKADRDTLEAA